MKSSKIINAIHNYFETYEVLVDKYLSTDKKLVIAEFSIMTPTNDKVPVVKYSYSANTRRNVNIERDVKIIKTNYPEVFL